MEKLFTFLLLGYRLDQQPWKNQLCTGLAGSDEGSDSAGLCI